MLSASLEIPPRSIIVAFAENILAPAPSKWTALVNVLVRRLNDQRYDRGHLLQIVRRIIHHP